MKTKIYLPLLILIAGLLFASCDVNNDGDHEEELSSPTIENVEVGSGNNELGVIGRDFHLDLDVVAGELIESVQIKIEQRSDETYSHEWSFEITWDQYAGVKNANVHKHFDIPEEAAEGLYDFVIIVNDQNGTILEETKNIEVIHPDNLPVDPSLAIFNLHQNYQPFYKDNEFTQDTPTLNKNDTLSVQGTIGGVKGDGVMYLLLIKKSLNHRPETIDKIDFSKAIVYDVFEHSNEEEIFYFSNIVYDFNTFSFVRTSPRLILGAEEDNNAPEPNVIDGDKSWQNGDYYFGIIYKNTTHNLTLFNYVEFEIAGF